MHPHHEEAIKSTISYFEKDPKVLAVTVEVSDRQ
jgi:hypothetical protein